MSVQSGRAQDRYNELSRQMAERTGIIAQMEQGAREELDRARRLGDPGLVAECQRHLDHVTRTKQSYERMNADAKKEADALRYQYGKSW